MIEKIKASLSNLASALTSIVCMGQMGASIAASAGSMVVMSATASTPFVTLALQAIGLGFLTRISDGILRPFLVAVLIVTILLSYFSYRKHKTLPALGLTALASAATYYSIYVLASETLYYASLALLLIAAFWQYTLEESRH